MEGLHVVRSRDQALVLGALRLALGLATAVPAMLAVDSDRALLGLALGALGFAVLGTMRQLELGRASLEDGLPPGARHVGALGPAVGHLYPSSIGVAALAVIAAIVQPGLAPVLAGLLVGMAIATFASAGQLASHESLRRVRVYAALEPPPRAYAVPRDG